MSTRFIGLDIHKRYLVATGVNADKQRVFGTRKVPMQELETWARKSLDREDAVVLEMTTNTWEAHDTLEPLVGSVTVVHPPHVSLITRAQVKTDKKAALTLAQLHAAGLLPATIPTGKRINQAMLARGKDKRTARVAIARKMLVDVWHILTEEKVDPFADPRRVACSLFALAYRLGVRNLPDGQSSKEYTRNQLDRFGIGMELSEIPWGTKSVKLPPSKLTVSETA